MSDSLFRRRCEHCWQANGYHLDRCPMRDDIGGVERDALERAHYREMYQTKKKPDEKARQRDESEGVR